MQSFRQIGRELLNRSHGFIATLSASTIPAQRVISAFREAGALTPQSAQRFHPSSVLEQAAFQQLLRLAVIREPAHGRYYLDERSLHMLQHQDPRPWR